MQMFLQVFLVLPGEIENQTPQSEEELEDSIEGTDNEDA